MPLGIRTLRTALTSLVLTASVGVLATSCSLVSNLDGDQCETTADCTGRGAQFANSACSPEKICVAAAALGCTSNAACVEENGGQPFVCHAPGEPCTNLLSEDCIRVIGDVATESPIILGLLSPLSGDSKIDGEKYVRQPSDLAQSEIKQQGGIPYGGVNRQLVVVECDEIADTGRAMRHLVDVVRVPAIVGPGSSGPILENAANETIPKDVLLMSWGASSPLLRTLDDRGLVWSTFPNDATLAVPLTLLSTKIEENIRSAQDLSDSDQIRVAMVVASDAYGQGLALAASDLISFNGKDLTENGDNFLRVDYTAEEEDFDFSPVIARVVEFQPHIVFMFGAPEISSNVLGPVEDNWPETDPATPRPVYLYADGGLSEATLLLVENDPGLSSRVLGAVGAPIQSGEPFNSFRIRHKAAFGEEPLAGWEDPYDAFYLLAYAVVASQHFPGGLTGPNIAQGLTKLIPPEGTLPILAGPNVLATGFSTLAARGAVNFTGVTGPLDFDPAVGDALRDVVIYCVSTDSDGKAAFDTSGSYARFNSETNQLEGPLECPDQI